MKKYLLFIFISAFSNQFFAQSEEFKSMITVSTFAPFRDQRYNFGYMRNVSERWWIGSELAYGENGIIPVNIGSFEGKSKIFEIRPEIFYSLAPESKLKHFVSAEAFYLNHTGKGISGNYYDRNEDYYSFSTSDYKRIKYGLNINYSILLSKRNSWFGFMPKIGFGLRQRKISYSNMYDRMEDNPPVDGLPFDYKLNHEGSDLRFNFNIDMKLIFKF